MEMEDENKKEAPTLDDLLENLRFAMIIDDGWTEEYHALVNNYERLTNLRLKETGTYVEKTNHERERARMVLEEARVENERVRNEIAELELKESRRISPREWLTAGVSIGSLLLILGYEQTHVLSTKALSFVRKP